MGKSRPVKRWTGKRHTRKRVERAASVLRLTKEQREVLSSPLVLTAPKRYTVSRGDTTRDTVLSARRAWKFVGAHFDDVRLDTKEGTFFDALEDYGSFKAKLTFRRSDTKFGVKFMGTPFYDKKGKSKERELKSSAKHRELIRAIFESLAATPAMQLINPRVGLFQGASTAWHVDSNSRGAHPNAVRPLDPGFGLEVYNGVDFRCSLLLWEGIYIIPLDLNPMGFRYIWWPVSSGPAEIATTAASDFWEGIVEAGPVVVGLLLCSIINFAQGTPLTCPLDHSDVRSSTAELDPLSFTTALSTAQSNPIAPPVQAWTIIGDDPDRWDVFYAWRNPHRSFGDGAARRVHVFSAALRQNPVGQFRSVLPGPPVQKTIDPRRAAISALQPHDMIEIEGAHGVRWRGLVIRVMDALDARDMIVSVVYEDEEGCMCIERQEHLGCRSWWHVSLLPVVACVRGGVCP